MIVKLLVKSELVFFLDFEVVFLDEIVIDCLFLEGKWILIHTNILFHNAFRQLPQRSVSSHVHGMHRKADFENSFKLCHLEGLLENATTVHDKER